MTTHFVGCPFSTNDVVIFRSVFCLFRAYQANWKHVLIIIFFKYLEKRILLKIILYCCCVFVNLRSRMVGLYGSYLTYYENVRLRNLSKLNWIWFMVKKGMLMDNNNKILQNIERPWFWSICNKNNTDNFSIRIILCRVCSRPKNVYIYKKKTKKKTNSQL